jgi:hypothetical protein
VAERHHGKRQPGQMDEDSEQAEHDDAGDDNVPPAKWGLHRSTKKRRDPCLARADLGSRRRQWAGPRRSGYLEERTGKRIDRNRGERCAVGSQLDLNPNPRDQRA